MTAFTSGMCSDSSSAEYFFEGELLSKSNTRFSQSCIKFQHTKVTSASVAFPFTPGGSECFLKNYAGGDSVTSSYKNGKTGFNFSIDDLKNSTCSVTDEFYVGLAFPFLFCRSLLPGCDCRFESDGPATCSSSAKFKITVDTSVYDFDFRYSDCCCTS